MLLLGLAIIAVAGLAGWVGALLIRHHAARLGLVQAANARSSHTVPTPTGGGLAIAIGSTLSGLAMLLALPLTTATVLLAGLAIAIIGFIDDRKPISARRRLFAQILCFALVVGALPLDGFAYATGLVWSDTALFLTLTLGGVLWINLFNFMDGIDGLAGSEAIFILLAALLVIGLGNPVLAAHPLIWWMAGTAAATSGFLLLNWSPARLFMGDAGSTFLGLMIGFFLIITCATGWISLPQWLLLMAAFLADALATLLRRLIRREPVWQAHRRHAYQRLATRFGHARVTLGYLGLDILALLPLALLAGAMPALGWPLAGAVLVALMVLAWVLGAGAPLDQGKPAAS